MDESLRDDSPDDSGASCNRKSGLAMLLESSEQQQHSQISNSTIVVSERMLRLSDVLKHGGITRVEDGCASGKASSTAGSVSDDASSDSCCSDRGSDLSSGLLQFEDSFFVDGDKPSDWGRAEALVEVLITFGTGCGDGFHGLHVFRDLCQGLERRFESLVFVLARENNTFNCISVHVNNVLVFGGQGRRPTVEQVCQEVQRAMDGQRPLLIPYKSGIACEYYASCQKHKYRV